MRSYFDENPATFPAHTGTHLPGSSTYPDPTAYFSLAANVISSGATADLRTEQTAEGGYPLLNSINYSPAAGGGTFFSIMLRGAFQAPASGLYTFTVISDDNSYLWLGAAAARGNGEGEGRGEGCAICGAGGGRGSRATSVCPCP